MSHSYISSAWPDCFVEYLVMDSLFDILARITPSANDIAARTALAKEVFQNAKAKKAFGKNSCDELMDILRNVRGDQWEKATDRIIVLIARTDPLKPQPFRLMSKRIYANSFVYIHPKSRDCIYLDSTGFVVNVQDGECIDWLEVAYRSVVSMQIQELDSSDSRSSHHDST
ncbi:hypothetical protein K439DRAFT_824507 [Ramaria rubella]|nr:hypothetical protein K439DRAFT_824507 [Ramaria rubella]